MKNENGIINLAVKGAAIGFGYIAGCMAGSAVMEKVQNYLGNKKTKENDSKEKES